MTFRWNEGLSVGVKAMDDQHLTLLETLNDLNAAMLRGDSKAVARPLILRMARYVQEHFSAEEAMLESLRYPGAAEHRVIHKRLTQRISECVDRFDLNQISLSAGMLSTLHSWFTSHIVDEDRKYGAWINGHEALAAEQQAHVCEITPRM